MTNFPLPTPLMEIIDVELAELAKQEDYNLPRESRIAIYEAIGPSNAAERRELQRVANLRQLPEMTQGDRVRTQVALATARKVLPLWEIACQESEQHFTEVDWIDKAEEQRREEPYLYRLQTQAIEEISVYDVPRAYVPTHILTMAVLVLNRDVQDFEKFRGEANEWWQIYPRPELMEREFFIKWTAQESLYQALGWTNHWPHAPVEDAIYAYAGVFYGEEFSDRAMQWDTRKVNEFWHWWLTEAIPSAWAMEHVAT